MTLGEGGRAPFGPRRAGGDLVLSAKRGPGNPADRGGGRAPPRARRSGGGGRVTQLVLSLFPGIGLLDMAFEEEGFTVVRGPDVLWGGDVRRFHPPAGRFEGVIGGPPCQAFSGLVNLIRAKGLEPRFGNLIPEFERCVAEARPRWFLMENVPAAPRPEPADYAVSDFTVCNSSLDGGDGLGLEQERVRRFSFGVRGTKPRGLREHIQLAALRLPGRAGAVTQTHVNNSPEARGRRGTVVHTPAPGQRVRTQAVTSSARAVPVALGGSGKLKPGGRCPAVTSSDGGGKRNLRVGSKRRARNVAVTAAHSGQDARPSGGHLVVYRWPDMLRLQGLPEDFLKDAPFTAAGKRKAVANGVPLPMGRAIARAIVQTLEAT